MNNVIPLFAVHMPSSVDKPLLEILHSGYIGQGKKVDEFEALLKKYLENDNLVTLNSGTSALHLALRLIGVEGGEVISTAMTCTATNMPIMANGAKIVWADIDPVSGLIDPKDVERKITSRTRAIMTVDWAGTPVDLDALMKIGKKYNIPVIEDAAHGIGALYGGKKVGSIADYTCFSLQAIKHITSVDGGILTMKDSKNYKRAKLLRWYGIDRETERKDFRCEEDITEWGYKFHMNDINATIGIEQMKYVDKIVEKHRSNAHFYSNTLDLQFYTPQFVDEKQNKISSYWLYTMLLPSLDLRVKFMAFMKDAGVMVSQVHARNDTHTTFKEFKSILPSVDQFVERQVSIPVHWKLTEEELKKIANACNKFAHMHSHV